jgi:hypothetical protein
VSSFGRISPSPLALSPWWERAVSLVSVSELEKQGEGVAAERYSPRVAMRAAPATAAVSPTLPASHAVALHRARIAPSPFLPRLLGRCAPCEAKLESPLPPGERGRGKVK